MGDVIDLEGHLAPCRRRHDAIEALLEARRIIEEGLDGRRPLDDAVCSVGRALWPTERSIARNGWPGEARRVST